MRRVGRRGHDGATWIAADAVAASLASGPSTRAGTSPVPAGRTGAPRGDCERCLRGHVTGVGRPSGRPDRPRTIRDERGRPDGGEADGPRGDDGRTAGWTVPVRASVDRATYDPGARPMRQIESAKRRSRAAIFGSPITCKFPRNSGTSRGGLFKISRWSRTASRKGPSEVLSSSQQKSSGCRPAMPWAASASPGKSER
jgi:hypothetical protein